MDIRRIFLENWPIKLASLILAVTLWIYVTSKGKTELSLTAPLEFRNIPRDMAVVGDVPGKIEVRLQGQERALRDIATSKKVVCAVDLSRGREGANLVRISPDDIRKPSGVLVTHLAPFEIIVKLEHLVRKTFRLKPILHGKPAAGYRVAGVSARPSKITLEGPEGVIRTFSALRTMPIDITGMKENATVEPRIDFQGKPVKVLEQDISITITLQKERP
jgi:YbbR domain-containing protein